MDELRAIDPESIGLIDESQGGFGATLWEGTERPFVEAALGRITAPNGSVTARSLLRRVLLSRTPAPSGSSGKKSLLALRVERLMDLGDASSAVTLLQMATPQLNDEPLSRLEVEAMFYQNNNSGACSKVRSRVQDEFTSYWQQVFAFCLALAGNYPRSELVAGILRERDPDIDPQFFAMIDALGGDKSVVIESLQNVQAYHLAMLRAASIKLPVDIAENADANVLRTVAYSPNADLQTRLSAAERAAAIGALSGDRLASLYTSISATNEELAAPISTAESDWGPRARALLLKAASLQEQATAKAEILLRAWQLARELGGSEALAKASTAVLRTIEPAPELAWFARAAGRTLFAAGLHSEGLAWYSMMSEQAEVDNTAKSAQLSLWPFAALAHIEDALYFDPDRLSEWVDATTSSEIEDGRSRVEILLSLLEALGRPVPPAHWLKLAEQKSAAANRPPEPAVLYALNSAVSEARTGEVIMLVLMTVGAEGPAQVGPLSIGAAVSALNRLGLTDEARALAVEAAVAAGI